MTTSTERHSSSVASRRRIGLSGKTFYMWSQADGDDVFVMYEYELKTGERHRNVEVLTVRDGQITEAQVFFGGRY